MPNAVTPCPRVPAGEKGPVAEPVDPGPFLDALAEARQIEDPNARVDAIHRWASRIPPDDIPGVLAGMKREELLGDPGIVLLQAWTKAQPVSAAAWADTRDDAAVRSALVTTAALSWAEVDAADALRWVWSLPDNQETVAAGIREQMAENEPEAALELVASQPPSEVGDELILRLLRRLATPDANATYEWLRLWPAGPAQRRALAGFVILLAQGDESLAIEIAEAELPPGEEQDRAILAVVEQWGRTDPAAAAAWVANYRGSQRLRVQLFGVLPPE